MAIDSGIALGVKPVQIPDVGKQFIEAQGLAQERQLRGLQIQAATRANQLADVDAQDQAKLRQIYTSSGGDPEKTVQGAIAAGVSPKNVQGLQQHFADYSEKLAKTKSDELASRKYQNDQYLGIIGKAKQQLQEDPEVFAQNYPQYLQAVAQIDPKEAAKLPTQPPTLDQLNMAEAAHGTDQYFIEQAKAKREAEELKLKQKEGEQKTALFPSQLTSAQSKATIDQAEAQGINMSPVAAKQKVDAVIDPVKYPEKNARALAMFNNAVTIKDKNAALDKVASEIGDVEKETNPQIRAARVQQAVDTENAMSPLRTAQAVATERAVGPLRTAQAISADVGKQAALAKLAPESFASIADHSVRAKAEADYDKDTKEAADKVAAAAQLGDFVTAAQSGNKAAPGLIPIASVRQLVNRVNRQELESVSSAAGSAYDRAQGFWNKFTEGQPIPPEILKDTAKIAEIQKNAADRTYRMKVDINNKTHGGSVKPVDFSQYSGGAAKTSIPDPVKQVLSGASVGVHTLSDGSVWKKLADGTIEKQ